MNKGDEFLKVIETSLYELRRLQKGPYQRADVAGIVDKLGSRLETFLRTVGFPSSARTDRLVDLIRNLPSAGLSQGSVAAIDALRILYNRSKHSPLEPLLLGDVIPTVELAKSSIGEMVSQGLGDVAEAFFLDLNYHLYVGFWDHYIGGETEVAICLPSDHWTHVSTVDTINMHWKSWDQLKPRLEVHPRFRLGETHFAAEVWESFKREDGFLTAGVWDGDYGELVKLLASFDDRQLGAQLLPGLARAHSRFSTQASIVASAVDAVRSASQVLSLEELTRDILHIVDHDYAIPNSAAFVQAAALQTAELLITLEYGRWRAVSGPVFLAQTKEGSSHLENSELMPLVLDGNALVLSCLR